jgi:osmotically-inducible protein OsmY
MVAASTTATNLRQRRTSSELDARIRAAAELRLRSSDHHTIRRISCDVVGGVIVLTGVVASYHIKQLAQEAVMGINGQSGVENRLKVE